MNNNLKKLREGTSEIVEFKPFTLRMRISEFREMEGLPRIIQLISGLAWTKILASSLQVVTTGPELPAACA